MITELLSVNYVKLRCFNLIYVLLFCVLQGL